MAEREHVPHPEIPCRLAAAATHGALVSDQILSAAPCYWAALQTLPENMVNVGSPSREWS